MSAESSINSDLSDLLARNEKVVTFYYSLFAFCLSAILIAHVVFAALYLVYVPANGIARVHSLSPSM
jgi:hypothetical protein